MSQSHSHSQYVKKPEGDSPTEPSSYSQRTLPSAHNTTMQIPTADMKKDSQLPPPPPPPPVPSKKRESWTEEEHRLFLIGLTKYGKGEWTRISSNVVSSKTSTQIASHAQKYFLRQTSCPLNASRKKRRSIHDITINESDHTMLPHQLIKELHQAQPVPHPSNPPTAEQESELMDYMNSLSPLPNCDFINDDIESLQQARATSLHLNPTDPNSLRQQQMDISVATI